MCCIQLVVIDDKGNSRFRLIVCGIASTLFSLDNGSKTSAPMSQTKFNLNQDYKWSMPLGLISAPLTFHCYVEEVFNGMYVEDVYYIASDQNYSINSAGIALPRSSL